MGMGAVIQVLVRPGPPHGSVGCCGPVVLALVSGTALDPHSSAGPVVCGVGLGPWPWFLVLALASF